jgi:hypothetical protein
MKKKSVFQITLVGLAVVVLFILPQVWGWTGFPALIIGALVIVTVILVRWHARNTGYRCPACDFTFVISPWTDFMSPHKSGIKMLRCPRCRQSLWCLEISRSSVTDDAPAAKEGDTRPGYSPAPLHMQIGIIVSLYVALWVVTLSQWTVPPETMSILDAIKIPIATVVLVIMHGVFCLFGARQGYRSRIYLLITIFVAAFLLLAIWIQYSQLTQTADI